MTNSGTVGGRGHTNGDRAEIGALAVLHTWTRTLEGTYTAPTLHLHCTYTAPTLHLHCTCTCTWLSVRLPEILWGRRCVVFAKAAVHGPERVLQYLGRYVHRTALTDKALIGCNDNRKTGSLRRSRLLSPEEWMAAPKPPVDAMARAPPPNHETSQGAAAP